MKQIMELFSDALNMRVDPDTNPDADEYIEIEMFGVKYDISSVQIYKGVDENGNELLLYKVFVMFNDETGGSELYVFMQPNILHEIVKKHDEKGK